MSQKQLDATPKAGRVFSEKELQEFSKGYIQLALEGIDAGDLDKARYWCQREADTNSQIHGSPEQE